LDRPVCDEFNSEGKRSGIVANKAYSKAVTKVNFRKNTGSLKLTIVTPLLNLLATQTVIVFNSYIILLLVRSPKLLH